MGSPHPHPVDRRKNWLHTTGPQSRCARGVRRWGSPAR
nr:MAG TPA: hypothetical protein [Caudoviricetes sp.]